MRTISFGTIAHFTMDCLPNVRNSTNLDKSLSPMLKSSHCSGTFTSLTFLLVCGRKHSYPAFHIQLTPIALARKHAPSISRCHGSLKSTSETFQLGSIGMVPRCNGSLKSTSETFQLGSIGMVQVKGVQRRGRSPLRSCYLVCARRRGR
jgi:hypothetical protein